ncbi:MAG: sugar phosphate isomerase/epimerase family protein [Candidatus Scalinduaceae bacterium]
MEHSNNKIALSTGSLYTYPFEESFRVAKELGFDGIELLLGPPNQEFTPGDIQDLSKKYNIPVLSIHSPFKLNGAGNYWDSMIKSSNIANIIKPQLLNVHPPKGIFFKSYKLKRFKNCLKGCKRILNGINLTVENMPIRFRNRILNYSKYAISDPDKLYHFSKKEGIHLTFDTTHLGTMSLDIVKYFKKLNDRILNIHISDYDRYEHLEPGKGNLPLSKLLKTIKSYDYKGLLTIELQPLDKQGKNMAQEEYSIYNSLVFCKKFLEA